LPQPLKGVWLQVGKQWIHGLRLSRLVTGTFGKLTATQCLSGNLCSIDFTGGPWAQALVMLDASPD
jgi:hypothetical protein